MKPWNKDLKKGKNIPCQICGINFYLSQKGLQKYCSRKCYFSRNMKGGLFNA